MSSSGVSQAADKTPEKRLEQEGPWIEVKGKKQRKQTKEQATVSPARSNSITSSCVKSTQAVIAAAPQQQVMQSQCSSHVSRSANGCDRRLDHVQAMTVANQACWSRLQELLGPGGSCLKEVQALGAEASLIGASIMCPMGQEKYFDHRDPFAICIKAISGPALKSAQDFIRTILDSLGGEKPDIMTPLQQNIPVDDESEFVSSFPVDIEVTKDFPVIRRLVGVNGKHMKYIEAHTGARVQVCGQGRVNKQSFRSEDAEGPLRIVVSANDLSNFEDAVRQVKDLIQTVRDDYLDFKKTSSEEQPDTIEATLA